MKSQSKKRFIPIWLWSIITIFVISIIAAVIAFNGKRYYQHTFTFDTPTTTDQTITLNLTQPPSQVHRDIKIDLTQGLFRYELLSPDKSIVYQFRMGQGTAGGQLTYKELPPGQYTLNLSFTNAQGSATIAIFDNNYLPLINKLLSFLPGALMLLVCFAFLWLYKHFYNSPVRYLFIGAAIWAVGVFLKFAWAIPTNQFAIKTIYDLLPSFPALIIGCIYIGLLTGIFEIGITILAAYRFKSLSLTASRAMTIGIGAGVIEALLLALVTLIAPFFVDTSSSPDTLFNIITPPSERIIAILCHIASRLLVFYAVATKRWYHCLTGFFILTAIDSIAGYYYLGQMNESQIWILELLILPFALLSLIIMLYLPKRWPQNQDQTPQQTSSPSDPEHSPT